MICTPITESTSDAFLSAIREAEPLADFIEARLDYLDSENLDSIINVLRHNAFQKPLILTFRPREQGGQRDLTLEDRKAFWSGLQSDLIAQIAYADLELDLVESFGHSSPVAWDKVICSFHDFDETPADVDAIFERLKSTLAGVVKVATYAKNVTDCARILDLSKNAGDRPFIVLGMGPAGIPSRILALSRGALLTFGSLRQGSESAEGQPTARDLRDLYRVMEINAETSIYGVIGYPVSHSLSPQIHNRAFARDGINAVYLPFEVSDLRKFVTEIVHPWHVQGLSVTIPHKIEIMEYLDWISPVAQNIGAVNTVVARDNKLIGFNTDVTGAMKPLEKRIDLKGARIAVLGAGGSAKAVVYGLEERGAIVTTFVRKTMDQFEGGFDVLINCTPVGMKGENEGRSPVSRITDVKLVYDLVYNPEETALIKLAREAGCETIGGLEMLYAQAEEQYRLWMGAK